MKHSMLYTVKNMAATILTAFTAGLWFVILVMAMAGFANILLKTIGYIMENLT